MLVTVLEVYAVTLFVLVVMFVLQGHGGLHFLYPAGGQEQAAAGVSAATS
jgi:hypothetical protein